MSHDHKPDLFKEKNRIYQAEGWVCEGRIQANLNLSRSLGDLEYKKNNKLSPKDQMITAYPEINIEIIDNDVDFIIIGCDGIWDCLTPQQACDFVKKELYSDNNNSNGNSIIKQDVKISKIVEKMMDSILPKKVNENETGIGYDNMSCIVIQFKK